MKKLCALLLCLFTLPVSAVIPEDGVYIAVQESPRGGPPSLSTMLGFVSPADYALITIFNGEIVHANGSLEIDFYNTISGTFSDTCPVTFLDLEEIDIFKQSDGVFTLSFNTGLDESGTPKIQAGSFLALRGELSFDEPALGVSKTTVGISYLDNDLQPRSCVVDTYIYAIKL